MFSALRARLLMSLSLTCALAPAGACRKSDDDASSVEHEKPKKPKKPKPDPPKKKKREWVPEGGVAKGHCTSSIFCTTEPEITGTADSDALRATCGSSAKIPESVAVKGFAGSSAWFNEEKTKSERDDEPDACCFSYMTTPCGKGRPLRHEGAPVLAREVLRGDWCDALALDLHGHDPAPLIEHLRRVALLEHASVAAFAQVSLELLSLGAPPDLIEAAHRAALDEIRHARMCWSVLAALEGAPRGPSPMAIPPAGAVDPEQVLVNTVIDGCVGETLGSLLFAEAARRCTVPALADMYATIAEEEAEHATLAFRIVQFLASADDSRVERALVAAACVTTTTSDATPAPDLGVLDAATQRDVLERGHREVVMPVLRALRGRAWCATPGFSRSIARAAEAR